MVKIIGKTYYVHKSNIKELEDLLLKKNKMVEKSCLELNINSFLNDCDLNYEIIKFDSIGKRVSFIESNNWNNANEPDVGKSYVYSNGKLLKIIEPKGQIYHNKWMFVSNDYKGFDIEEAKKRTEEWNSIKDIKQHKSRIGYKNYWANLLKKNNIKL